MQAPTRSEVSQAITTLTRVIDNFPDIVGDETKAYWTIGLLVEVEESL